MSSSASAATFTFPANQTFAESAAGWESLEAQCTSDVLPELLPFCQAANDYQPAIGIPPGSLEARFGTVAGAVGEIEAAARTTWATTFTYNQGAPTQVTFSYDRRAELIPLINLGVAQSLVTLTDLTTTGTTTIVAPDNPVFTPLLPDDGASFQSVTANVAPGFLVPGHQYRLSIQTFFRGTLAVLGGQRVNYDNVRLTVEAPPGEGGGGISTGPRGPRQVLPGAGGLGACTPNETVPQPPEARPGDPGGVTLSAQQLLINQRISQAAVRRVNAAIDEITAGLTGNDIRDCALRPEDFNNAFIAALLGPEPAGPSTGVAAPRPVPNRTRQPRDPGSVRLQRTQLLINQRISQAAVRRVNAVRQRLNNLTAGDFLAGTIDATALGTELRRLLGGGAPTVAGGQTRFVPITPKAPGPRNPGAVKLTREQLLINQRISQAAVRRVNQVLAELAAGVTSRNIANDSLVRENLTPPVQVGAR